MIGEYKGKVRNKVVTALLQAYHDCLDYDGMKSILREAEMMKLKNIRDIDPEKTLDFFSFKKIIAAQNCLLFQCTQLLFEIGRKFSFYLFPFGKDFEEVVEEIDEYIDADWHVEIVDRKDEQITVKVRQCVFCSEVGVSCDLFEGFLVHSLEKTLKSDKIVKSEMMMEHDMKPLHNNFFLRLSILPSEEDSENPRS
jgi:predicted hydrocarbon binding protein